MSSYIESKIFNDIIKYFKKYSKYKIIVTKSPIKKANVYFYFRPHLENNIKKNSIITVHHDLKDKDKNLNINNFINKYKKAEIIVCLNSEQKEILKKYNISNVFIIPHGYNSEILVPSLKKIKKKIIIGFLSNYYPRLVKGEDYFLKLISKLDKNKYIFLLVGKKRYILANELKKMGFTVKSYEYLPYFLYKYIYNLIHLLLITSSFEGGPASLPEALATATPIISTNVGMVNDFKKNEIMLLNNDIKKDVQLFYNIEEKIINVNKNLLNKKINNLLTWKEVIEKYDQLFEEIDKKFSSKEDYNKSITDIFFNFLKIIDYNIKTFYIKKYLKKNIKMITSIIDFFKFYINNNTNKFLKKED